MRALVMSCLLLASSASAQTEPAPLEDRAALEAAYQRATEREHARDPRGAVAAWREVERLGPTSRFAARARRRLAWLNERSEGDYVPLEALLELQAAAPSPEELEAFTRRIDAMPAGRVRIESRLAAAQALAAAGEPERAVAMYRAVIDEPGVREDEARLARDELAGAIAGTGDVSAALAELEGAGMGESARHGVLLRAARRRFLEPVAWAVIAVFVILALAGIHRVRGYARARSALLRPASLLTVATIALGPYLIARIIGDEATDAFAVLGLANGVGMLLVFAARGAFQGVPTPAPSALSWTALLAALGAGYLAALYHAHSLPFA